MKHVAAGALALAVCAAIVGGCASSRSARFAAPDGGAALGLPFGRDRAAAERTLRDAGTPFRPASDDPDAIVADRCPSSPVAAPCRLVFGPVGLYAAELEVPAADAGALVSAVEGGLGRPDGGGDAPRAAEGSSLVAAWHRPGWSWTVARTGAVAALRVESDTAAPPVVAGVALGRLRADVEGALARQGATLVQRDATATTYLGCPQGASDALSCVVIFAGGRAASVTEIHPAASDDRGALDAWEVLARRFEKDIGRPPSTACPESGPDRVGGDCTATWASDRLTVVVGAHRNAGASHRGAISVYTAFTYPPLAAKAGEEAAEDR
ncbi:MAG TPA: hypothetical protein VFK90_07755 [Anaeromyxobacter sp.]|nr:hypothetical protein [Anaeromyxobacter sp.]